MKYLIIDLSKFKDMKALHRYLAKGLDFPDYYGNNLDALADCLDEVEGDMTLVLMNVDAMDSWSGGKKEAFLGVLENASRENPNIAIKTL